MLIFSQITFKGKVIQLSNDNKLRLPNCFIKDIDEIEGLYKLNNIEVLWLDHNEIKEIKGLETLVI